MFLLLLALLPVVHSTTRITGNIVSLDDRHFTPSQASKFLVWAMGPLEVITNKPQLPTFDSVQTGQYAVALPTHSDGSFSFADKLSTGSWYTVFAFYDANDNKLWDVGDYEACGWNKDLSTTNQMQPVRVTTASNHVHFNITLNSSPPIPDVSKNTTGGFLRRTKGIQTLTLSGSPAVRGYAHGKLLAANIISFFRWFLLEQTTASVKFYKDAVIPMLLTNVTYEKEFTAEIKGILKGMRDSGENLWIPELEREFELTELMYANNYGIRPIGNFGTGSAACSQFSFSGVWTDEGRTITGRNMDGENDMRKATISNFVMFAVDPEKPEYRYVSFAWPGFIVSTSGLNEKGIHSMINGGTFELGSLPDRYYMTLWMSRNTLAKAATLDETKEVIKATQPYHSCAAGCEVMLAAPHMGGSQPSSMVYEGNRKGGEFRYPMEAAPKFKDMVMTTNHNLKYGFNISTPTENWGRPIRLSSLWRYAAGEALIREFAMSNTVVDTNTVQQILKNVCHGTTEHSIITHSNTLEFFVGVGQMKGSGWWAPYTNYSQFQFEELFG